MSGGLMVAGDAPRSGRRMRKPRHTFNIAHCPFGLKPFMIAPVLAGETLKSMLFQSRAVTLPIKNALIGWHLEYYFFYVKLTDIDEVLANELDEPDDAVVGPRVKMLLADPTFDKTAWDYGSAAAHHYAVAESQTYVSSCMTLIRDHYFRDEADLGDTTTLNSLWAVGVQNTGALDSAILNDDFTLASAAVDVDLLGDATDDVLTVSEIDKALQRYQLARSNGLTDATYEDYLASFGIGTPKIEKPHKPELIRYSRNWQYPSNTVEPTTGVPSSAVSWAVQERADKDRFFKEPGFIIGVTVARPKTYISAQVAHMAGFLDRAEDWNPAWLWGYQDSTYKKYAQGTGPYTVLTDVDGYWVDMRDLYMHGDQWIDSTSSTVKNLVALPTATLGKKFPSSADINAMFTGAAASAGITQDGVVDLTIASSLRDTSRTT